MNVKIEKKKDFKIYSKNVKIQWIVFHSFGKAKLYIYNKFKDLIKTLL